jgi:putative oxidoreductase
MSKTKALKITVIAIRIALGVLFIYAGYQKFIPKERPAVSEVQELPDHVVKIKAFIGGMKQTGYFWPFLGIAEIVAGALLLSQVLSLLGAFILFPVTLNIFLFHLFLEPHEPFELFLTGLYLVGNLFIILYEYPKLKPVFITKSL